jgi:hypothetical protein
MTMDRTLIEVGQNFRHVENGQVYTVTGTGRMHVVLYGPPPLSHAWMDCVMYRRGFDTTYVRTVEDFCERFLPVP